MTILKRVGSWLYKWWMRFARLLAFVNTRVILTLVYILIIGPVAAITRMMGKDFLERKIDRTNSFWKAKPKLEHTIENARHQF